MPAIQIEERAIKIEIREHRNTHLLVAVSEDLPGLLVAARSDDQLDREIPEAIREIFEAQGTTVISVTMDTPKEIPGDFIQRTIAAHAKISSAQ